MARFSFNAFRDFLLIAFALVLCLVVGFYEEGPSPLRIRNHAATSGQPPPANADGSKLPPVTERLGLSGSECRATFPGVFADIDHATQAGKMMLKKDAGDYAGLVQGWIRDNKIYILTTSPSTSPQVLHQRTAVLSQLHRALLTSPTILPSTPFAFAVNDSPRNTSWAFSRPNKPSLYALYLLPTFAFWSWPSVSRSPFDDALSRISSLESITPWENKIDKAVWRGTPWFNSIAHPTLRQDLLKATRGKEWADVAALDASGENALAIEEFCRYKYVVYTEGVTYSGRLPYHQACGSVLITAPLGWLTHTAWWMRPIEARDLLGAFGGREDGRRDGVREGAAALLATVSDWREANAVYVSPGFGDLDEVIGFLRAYPEVAQRIARNQREAVVESGYLSGAAEVCYWRGLVAAWAENVVVGPEWEVEVGERYETWLLREVASERHTVRITGDSKGTQR